MADINMSPFANNCEEFFNFAKEIAERTKGFCEIAKIGGGHARIFLRILVSSGSPWQARDKAESTVKFFNKEHFRDASNCGHSESLGEPVWIRHHKEFKLRNVIVASPPTASKPKL